VIPSRAIIYNTLLVFEFLIFFTIILMKYVYKQTEAMSVMISIFLMTNIYIILTKIIPKILNKGFKVDKLVNRMEQNYLKIINLFLGIMVLKSTVNKLKVFKNTNTKKCKIVFGGVFMIHFTKIMV